ncbi:MAG TPA: CDP-diacylglycerol--glycerol-3-phosphate 3-phosphatidyltransferase [Candidatus Onthocola gallistercoris]|uniref:CDP-diacylglycerol--glycerol-3-phosphate 3-phosphatidyltransferase n=1 Tax=Candidatus Onthocola gallistercoris TaxID=2840876 RepID=A0A9D1KV73_9FIRM|nr:CDP-diacylglycerol--glycerol-3-phosphate 3-phosphatidyltransferase [Candidatus Onthocola gallistercoris]
MNLPNKLTVLRVILIPFFVVCLLNGFVWPATIFFILASLTDMLDGKIARKYHLVTNFGKFMDPLADKLLVAAALICFVELGRMPAWIVLIIISREFFISGFRLVAAEGGVVIAAGYWGKLKTAVTMVTIIFMLPDFGGTAVHIIEQILIYLSLALTIISMIDYVVKNKSVLGGKM